MTRRASAGQTARLLLRYHRDPSRYRSEAIRADAPTIDFDVVLRLAQKRDVTFGHSSLEGASPEALHDAAVAYLRNVCFRSDATPYETLGLARDASSHAIKERFRLLMLLVHPDRHQSGAAWPADCAAQANRAYAVLRSPDSRAKFDREERERVERAREAQQAAVAAAAASASGSATWRAVPRTPKRPPEPVLPEWLTYGVGGFVRTHPAGVAFGGLIAAAALVAGVALWETDANSLMRKTRASAPPAALEPLREPEPAAAAPSTVHAATRAASAPAKPREVVPARAEPETAVAAPAAKVPPPAEPAIRVAAVVTPVPATMPPGEAARTVPAASPSPVAEPPREKSAAPQAPPAPAATPPPVAREVATAAVVAPPVATRSLPTATPPAVAAVAPPTATPPAVAAVAPPTAAPPAVAAVAPPTATPPAVAVAAPSVAPAPTVTVAALPAAAPPVPPPVARPTPAAAAFSPPAAVDTIPVAMVEASPRAPTSVELETFFVTFVDAYDHGRGDAFARMFDDDARANQHSGRAAIRREYDELFRQSEWRRMQLMRMNWRRVGDIALANGEIMTQAGMRDGRQVEQKLVVDLELARRDGRIVITRLSQRPSAP